MRFLYTTIWFALWNYCSCYCNFIHVNKYCPQITPGTQVSGEDAFYFFADK